jgi:hypothetical protein
LEKALHPSQELMQKIGAIVVHALEWISPGGMTLDQQQVHVLLNDPEVRRWLLDMGPLVPLPRTPPLGIAEEPGAKGTP